MAELVREIVIDATPETIWPFLTESGQARRLDWFPGSHSSQRDTATRWRRRDIFARTPERRDLEPRLRVCPWSAAAAHTVSAALSAWSTLTTAETIQCTSLKPKRRQALAPNNWHGSLLLALP